MRLIKTAIFMIFTAMMCILFTRDAFAMEFVVPVETLNNMGIDSKLSECVTKYKVGEDRSLNIEVAANYLNGTILNPGQPFSYNVVIGPRMVERGFGPGNAISGGKYIKVIGGGICQLSSTLNNAVLGAGIIPTERHNHSTGVHYLPTGLDATVSYGTLDYQFVNTLQYPVYIQALALNGVLKVALYSNHDALNGYTYRTQVVGNGKRNTTYLVANYGGVDVLTIPAYSSAYK